jgi:HD-GYP domain-containing protein (c-di-GMP phosphodiesterase class II)
MIESSSGIHPTATARAPSETHVRVPIRFKITVPYLLLAILLALGAAYVMTHIVFDSLEEKFTHQLIEVGMLSSEWMVLEEENRLETLRLLTYTSSLAEALDERDPEALRQLSYGIAVNHQEDAVEFLEPNGTVVLSMRRIPGGGLEDYSFVRGGSENLAQQTFVQYTLSGQADELGDKYSGIVETELGWYFYVSGPVYASDGRVVGAVLVGKQLDRLVRQMREEVGSQITLYGLDGSLLATSFIDPPVLTKAETGAVLLNQETESIKRSIDDRRELTSANLEYEELMGPWEVRGDVDLGVLGVALYKSNWVSTSGVTRLQITLLVGFALALVILTGLMLAQSITRPLIRLMHASAEVSRGNLNVKVNADSNDETAVLADTFNHMVLNLNVSKKELVKAYDNTLLGWSRALELRDKETEGHSLRVTQMTVRLARRMGMRGEQLTHIQRGVLLHDIGKMGIPDSILLKEGPLSADEWEVMRKHPQYAYDMLWPIHYLRPAIAIPFCHHERWDGQGYPNQLKAEEIPLEARIFAVIDVWDALTSDRPYRKAMSKEKAMNIILEESGTHFDPQVVEQFVAMLAESTQSEH